MARDRDAMRGWGRFAAWRVALAGATLVLAFGCSSRRDDAPLDVGDASTGERGEHEARVVADGVLKALTVVPRIGERFGANPDGLQRTKDGVVSPGWRSAWTQRAFHVGARVPALSNQPFEAGVGVSELYRVTLQPVGANAASLALDAGRAVYRDAFPSTDVTFSASPERLEWAYTLRDGNAPAELTLRVTLPKNLPSARVDGRGGIELYPIVLDPALETAVWQPRVLIPSARDNPAMAYDSARKRVVLFGGTGADWLSDTWEYDGIVWGLRSTSGPPARDRAAMTYDGARGVTVLFGGLGPSSTLDDTWEWNGTAWVARCTTAPCSSTVPPARRGAAMTFDAARGKAVLFGGFDGAASLSDTWTWNGAAWALSTATGPAARFHHGLTFDSAANRVLLFGGRKTDDDSSLLNDVWSFNGTAWTSVTTTGGPPSPRASAAFVFQSAIGRALLFGGAVSGAVVGDTWELVSATNAWVSVGGTMPAARRSHAAAYDSSRQTAVIYGGSRNGAIAETWEFKDSKWSRGAGEVGERLLAASAYDSWRNRIVLFGGTPGTGVLNDTWEWTGFGWSQACTTAPCSSSMPSARWGAAGAYDSARRQFVIFGGRDAFDLNDTWEFDGAQWVQRCTAAPCSTTRPSERYGAAMAFDSKRGRAVLFGGTGGMAETWEWNGSAWARACDTAPCSTTLPPGRKFAAAAFDSDRNRVVVFGGAGTAWLSVLGDTWEYTGTAWVQVATTGPSAREQARLAYDPVRKKTILFGGYASGGGALGDTWEWDGSTWTMTTSSGPAARGGHTLEYDAARRRTVAFGGLGGLSTPDTWEYYSRGGGCAVGTQCLTGYCVDGVCCEQLQCDTCQACDLAGSAGRCATVTSTDDSDSCPAATKTCDATGSCKKKQAQSCTAASECASGHCANGWCCNQACTGGCDVCNATPGTCTSLAKGATGASCGGYLCDGASGECPKTCAVDADCAPTFFCAAGGVCQARRAQGGSCNVGSGGDCMTAGCRECSGTLTCKDGYCCSGGCAGSCQTCAATPGTCTTVTSADDPDTCSGASTCSSSGACLARNGQGCTAGTQCGSGFCADGVCCNSACAGGCDVCNATAGTCTIVAQGSAGASPACGAFVCNGSLAACPTGCGNDADCSAGYYCNAAGTCVARKSNGATCNTAAGVDCKTAGCRTCASNSCIDGYCCDTACGGSCDACNGAALGWPSAVNGTCAIAPVSYAGSPSCGAYACSGASAGCATGCTSDAQCGAGSYCDAAGACVAQKTQGAACNLATDCKSGSCRACATGNCVDGYCCNTACGGQCQACDVSGALGTCVTVTGAVHGARPACSGTGACAASCNGTDATACRYAGSSVACGTASCASGVATNVGTCNGAGVCNQSTTPCGAYACGTAACRTSCTADSDCASSSYYCAGSACVAKKANGDACTGNNACTSGNCVSGICCDTACGTSGYSCAITGSLGRCSKVNGQTCTTAAECGSGRCVDGVCCDSTCTGQCQACNVAGSLGTCSNVIGAPASGRSACGGTGAGTTCGARCNGTSATACAYPTGTTSCSSASCTSGAESTAGTCNGGGVCSFTTKACGAYVCGATSCKSVCTGDTDCASGFYCNVGTCTAKAAMGASCTGASSCASGNCVDGVCCGSSSCGAGQRCNVPGALGTCSKPNGTACTVSTDCASGFCVDGVCCDTGCGSQCAACDVTGKVGTCSAVTGAPRGSRPACAGTGAGDTCGPVCNGTDMAACHYPTASTSCGDNACTNTGGTYIERHQSSCNGAGACSDVPKTCGGFVCGATSCVTSCTTNAECTTGNYCKSGACIPIEGL
ncbi:MAG: hypothetical protein HYV09_33805, partial [Deltaproteobacteria bacterium]|nr:hypothetical protein [Deltaproteobacteria bacterium]